MSRDEAEGRLIAGYIRDASWPAQWVAWWFEMPDSEGRERLGALLFGPEGESLQDLSDPAVREVVIREALADHGLARVVLAELDQSGDAVRSRVALREPGLN